MISVCLSFILKLQFSFTDLPVLCLYNVPRQGTYFVHSSADVPLSSQEPHVAADSSARGSTLSERAVFLAFAALFGKSRGLATASSRRSARSIFLPDLSSRLSPYLRLFQTLFLHLDEG